MTAVAQRRPLAAAAAPGAARAAALGRRLSLARHSLLLRTSVLGVLITLTVLAADYYGRLITLEWWFYDERARYCQNFTPQPTDQLVHLDVDDAALETIGAWPWPRATLARIVDEFRLAGARSLALDIVFSEPKPPELVRMPAEGGGGDAGAVREVDHDAAFAASLRRFGNVVLPVSFDFEPRQPRPPIHAAAVARLHDDLEITYGELARRLRERFPTTPFDEDEFLGARREAMARRIAEERARAAAAGTTLSTAELRRRLIPGAERWGPDAPLSRIFAAEHLRLEAAQSIRRFSRPRPQPAETNVARAGVAGVSDASGLHILAANELRWM